MSTTTESVLEAIAEEREEQEKKHGASGRVVSNPYMMDGDKMLCLIKQVGEVSQLCTRDDDPMLSEPELGDRTELLYHQLVQVAGVATAWAESL